MAAARPPGVLAGLFVLITPFITGGTTASLTTYVDCRDSDGDSCIPFPEIGFGAAVLGITFAWIALRLLREHDWIKTIAAVYVSLGVWMLMMLPVVWRACPREAFGGECTIGLKWGMALVPISIAIAARGLWRPGGART